MTQSGTVEVRPGSTVWWEGALWRIEAVHPHDVVLRRDTDVARVPFRSLIDGLRTLDPAASDCPGDPLGSIALSSLSHSARASVEESARVITNLLEGDGPWGPRMDATARELGVDVRTVRRRVAAFRERGVAGLVDSTATQRRTPRVDPRWDAVCLDVLKEYTNKSTPTQGAVIDEVSRRVVAQHGRDVALPHRATAYRRLKELEKGRYTFGSAKARRSVAARADGAPRLPLIRPGNRRLGVHHCRTDDRRLRRAQDHHAAPTRVTVRPVTRQCSSCSPIAPLASRAISAAVSSSGA